ncbi:uncharacterized protein LOC133206027 [Saccostrea echinata]|uniref:uncharacterized protein LOC133206027 n=1 Tax=Saccostrea echinata TaxID=191078 RepID=UPI002A812CBB|nr:uncharacterized protein LOC133206027 [Saccostrea echinata]
MEFEIDSQNSLVSNLKQDENGNEVKSLMEISSNPQLGQGREEENDRENKAPSTSDMNSKQKTKKVKIPHHKSTTDQMKKCKRENRVGKPERTACKGTKSKIKIESNGNNDTISVRRFETKLQRFCNVVQVKKTRAGKLHFFTGCIPIFLMCGTEQMLFLNETVEDTVVFFLMKENGQIISILTDFLLPGNYLINRFFSDNKFDSCPDEFLNLYPESRLSLQVKILSPYLSSTTDPIKGHHFIMIGHITQEPVHYIVDENSNLKAVVEEFEKENLESCFEVSVEKDANKCDHLFYCMTMSVLRKVKAQSGVRKRTFQMRIQFIDELMLKRKKKKSGNNLKTKDVVEVTGDDKEEDLSELEDDSI